MSLRKRLFFTMVLILLAGFVGMAQWIRGELRNSYAQVIENFLIDSSHFFSSMIEQKGMNEKTYVELDKILTHYKTYQSRIKNSEFLKNTSPLDVYVTDKNGKVVYSTNQQELGQDFSKWNDVYNTLRGEYGARSTRINKSDSNTSIYYVASPIKSNGEIIGVVTVYKIKNSILLFSDEALKRIYMGGLFSIFSLVIFGGLLLLWVTIPLEKLKNYALKVSNGNRPALPESSIKEIKQLGDAFEKMRVSVEGKKTIEKYTQALTHELKSPLTAIKGAAELCLEEMDEKQRHRFLKNIITESDRSHIILEQLLKIAALESKTTLDQIEKINVSELINENKASLYGLLEAKKISVEVSSSGSDQIYGDRFLLSQAIRNILHNAIEFSEEGSKIEVKMENRDHKLILNLTDEGTGIPEYARARVFEKFYSLERPDTKKKGTGLGLSFVKEVINLHKGNITVTSPAKNEKGTLVHIEIPNGQL